MALDFDSGTTDKVTVTNPQTLGSGSEITWAQWIYRTTGFANSQGTGKGVTSDVFVRSNGTMFFNVGRATTLAEASMDELTYFPVNTWCFIAGTYSEADGPRLFQGTLTARVAEVSYVARAVGAGATSANSGDLFINNRGASNSLAIGCRIATFAWFSRRLTLQELIEQQYSPGPRANCQFFAHLGYGGATTVPDLSGNQRNGTGTGLITGVHVPLTPPWRRDTRIRRSLSYLNVGAATRAQKYLGSRTDPQLYFGQLDGLFAS